MSRVPRFWGTCRPGDVARAGQARYREEADVGIIGLLVLIILIILILRLL